MKLMRGVIMGFFIIQTWSVKAQFSELSANDLYGRSLREPVSADTLVAYGRSMLMASVPMATEEKASAQLILADGYIKSRQYEMADPLLGQCRMLLADADPELKGYLHYHFGELYRYRGAYDECLLHLDSALTYSGIARDTLNLTRVFCRMSVAYRRNGDTDAALEAGIRSLEYAHITGVPLLIAQSTLTLGNMYFSVLKDYEKTLELYETALMICEENGFDRKSIALLYNLGNTCIEMERFEDALVYLQRSADLALEKGIFRKQAHAYRGIGLVHKRQGDFDEAQRQYNKAFSIYKELNDPADQAKIYNFIASLKLSMEQTDSARYYAEKSVQNAKETGDLQTLHDAYQNLSDAALEADNAEAAFDFYRSAQLYKDSLRKQQYNEKVLEMATRYEATEKQQQLEMTQVAVEKRAFERNVLIATTAVLLLFIGVYYNVQRKKKRLAVLLSRSEINDLVKGQELKLLEASVDGQEQERQRIAIDLHDRIGSLLSTVRLKFSSMNNDHKEHAEMTKGIALLDRSLTEVRRISQDLASGTLVKFGLEGAIRDLVQTFEFADEIKFTIHFHGLEKRLNSEVERVVFRVVQESVSNALKHSGCNEIDIQINRLEDMVNVMVVDNGKGFDPREFRLKGMGLKGMKARVAKFMGTFNIDSGKGRGTTINIDIPVTSVIEP